MLTSVTGISRRACEAGVPTSSRADGKSLDDNSQPVRAHHIASGNFVFALVAAVRKIEKYLEG